MKNLIEFLKDIFKTEYITEMATICRSIKLDSRRFYKIAIHGPSTKDRDYPHIHIYDANDNTLKLFNFEISVIDIICNDELNIILQVDRSKHIRRTNRSECSWDGYTELRDNFENWLYSKSTLRGDFKDNLDAIIWSINNESPSSYQNYILDYVAKRDMKVGGKFKDYFSEEDRDKYKKCFN